MRRLAAALKLRRRPPRTWRLGRRHPRRRSCLDRPASRFRGGHPRRDRSRAGGRGRLRLLPAAKPSRTDRHRHRLGPRSNRRETPFGNAGAGAGTAVARRTPRPLPRLRSPGGPRKNRRRNRRRARNAFALARFAEHSPELFQGETPVLASPVETGAHPRAGGGLDLCKALEDRRSGNRRRNASPRRTPPISRR